MNSLEQLKKELILQKSEIENKGGSVSVANTNPSPSEITEGIKSIELTDFAKADASADDVLLGKKFYSGNKDLKVGSLVVENTNFEIATATANDVLSGKTFYAGNSELKTGGLEIVSTDFEVATATANDVLSGKTFYAGNSELKTGGLEIVSTDFEVATATEQDVMAGKTFYAGNSELKVGSYSIETENYRNRHLFEYEQEVKISEDNFSYNINPLISKIRYGFFRNNYNNVDIYFHSNITEIGSYSFANTPNFRFYNFNDMTNLVLVDSYAFEQSNGAELDLSAMPASIKTLNQKAFSAMLIDGCSVALPANLVTMQQYCFHHATPVHLSKFEIPQSCKLTTLNPYSAYGICSESDLYVPTVKTIGARFNYNGSFKNITFDSIVTSLADKCFSADTIRPLSDCTLKTVTFLGTTPPTIPTEPFSAQAIENGFKIYVPDESLEAYIAKFPARYQSCIYPMSQKA